MNTSFFGELLQTHLGPRSRAGRPHPRPARRRRAARSESLVDMCEELLSGRGEASGTALARDILQKFAELTTGPRIAFFEALAHRFGPDRERIARAIAAWQRRRPTRPPPSCTPPPSRAARSCCAVSISRRAAPRRWSRCASS